MTLTDLLGETVVRGSEQVATSSLDADVVGLYFSAHWCPPCKRFTPMLAECYKKIRADGKKFEVIFVSSDRDQGSFDEYYGSMPWLAVPFSDRTRKEALSKKYKVNGIPSLILLDRNGKIVNKEGVEVISSDLQGADFPWAVKSFNEIIGDTFMDPDCNTVTRASLEGKILCIYFSAHWCPPCKAFTPELVKTYNKLQAAGKNVQIIFASSDRSEEAFDEYYDEMPWLAIPYDDRKRKDALSAHFGVQGIPTLVVVDTDGSTITTNGRAAVSTDPEGAEFPWHPKPIADLSASPEGLNEEKCVILFLEKADEATRSAMEAALLPVAEEHQKQRKATDGEEGALFFTCKAEDGVGKQVRRLTGLGEAKEEASVKLVLIDIPDSGGYYVCDTAGPLDEAKIRAFVDGATSGSLPRIQMQ